MMPLKSQFNIKISKDLLIQVKRQATMLGKSLTEHITDLVTQSLEENNIKNTGLLDSNDLKCLNKRLINIESIVSNREYLSKGIKPFTNYEAVNCTKFMRGLFREEVKKRNIDDNNDAFNELFENIEYFEQLNEFFYDRLKEVILSDKLNSLTGKELNELTDSNKCNCPIRKGLINWTGLTDLPSQQEICDKGDELLPLI